MTFNQWQYNEFISVPFANWAKQELRVLPISSTRPEYQSRINVTFKDGNIGPITLALSLDDAENFATLILYKVKQMKGELPDDET